MRFWRGSGYADPGVYNSPRDFFRDLAAIYRAEIADLAAAGCRYIQLDEVALAMLCDPAVRERVTADGNVPARVAELYVEAIREAVAVAPPGMVDQGRGLLNRRGQRGWPPAPWRQDCPGAQAIS
jgi:5-methyltetrahydropteroyltriglutamate--homocysteine methyltransferase